jgi:hypothetical protein
LRLAAVAGATFSHSRRQLLAPAVHGRAFRRPFTFTLPCLATLAQSKRAGDNITYKADNPPLQHQHASISVIKTASARGAACSLQLPLSLTLDGLWFVFPRRVAAQQPSDGARDTISIATAQSTHPPCRLIARYQAHRVSLVPTLCKTYLSPDIRSCQA